MVRIAAGQATSLVIAIAAICFGEALLLLVVGDRGDHGEVPKAYRGGINSRPTSA